MTLNIVILAAGQGKRMQSHLPKVLHPLAGKPLLEHVISVAQTLNPSLIYVVYGYGGEQVRQQLSHLPVQWIEQNPPLGTGHAVAQALPLLDDKAHALILVGDNPLISPETLQRLQTSTPSDALGLLTAQLDNPEGLGRVIRDEKNNILKIVEDKDATPDQKNSKETYTGIMLAPVSFFKKWIPHITTKNVQGEYYLTDLIAIASNNSYGIVSTQCSCKEEVQGVNDRIQLAQLERYYQSQIAKHLMLNGVSIIDPQRLDIRGDVRIGQDTTLDINVILEGNVVIGSNCYIGSNTILRNVRIADNVSIKANCVIEEAEIGEDCSIGPFARIRPGTVLAPNVHIGNFVEIKNSQIGEASKANHLSYLGDAKIEEDVNIGAGTITCNYDGINKHQTEIGKGAFIGSNTSLVAPLIIGPGATIGAGSTITKDTPAEKLTLARARQLTIDNWQKPRKKKDN